MRRIIAALALVIGTLAVWPSAPAQAVDYFQFRNVAMGNCLTLVGSAAHDRAWIGHYPCDGSDGQKWRLENLGLVEVCVQDDPLFRFCAEFKKVEGYRIHSKVTDKCVDLSDRSISSGTRVHQYSCYDTNSQQWYFKPNDDGSQSIMSVRAQNQRAKQVAMEPRYDDPNKAQIWTFNGTALQTWERIAG
ncbi:RICIN domain-containing protein [Nonomuraea zeae]|uniref:Ricin B lectin domain-containing protein n=1 Tax=Nonomuraea zeae TaxID=1642303 RepID=A0A5S4HE67_9ACTN|nr:RICIN domain-containing protein [Nonomuraea zeae]TMR37190.1 hypothetical protein ETD85_08665 [Nonomuraea zeae]